LVQQVLVVFGQCHTDWHDSTLFLLWCSLAPFTQNSGRPVLGILMK